MNSNGLTCLTITLLILTVVLFLNKTNSTNSELDSYASKLSAESSKPQIIIKNNHEIKSEIDDILTVLPDIRNKYPSPKVEPISSQKTRNSVSGKSTTQKANSVFDKTAPDSLSESKITNLGLASFRSKLSLSYKSPPCLPPMEFYPDAFTLLLPPYDLPTLSTTIESIKRQHIKTTLVLIIKKEHTENYRNVVYDMVEPVDIILEFENYIQRTENTENTETVQAYRKSALEQLSTHHKLPASTVIIDVFPSSFFESNSQISLILDHFQSANTWYLENANKMVTAFRLGFYKHFQNKSEVDFDGMKQLAGVRRIVSANEVLVNTVVTKTEEKSLAQISTFEEIKIIHIVMCVYQREQRFPGIMQNLKNSNTPGYKIHLHVCVNHPNNIEIVKKYAESDFFESSQVSVDYVIYDNHWGFARFEIAQNLFKRELVDYVIMIDDDETFSKSFIFGMYEEREPKCYVGWYGRFFKYQGEYWKPGAISKYTGDRYKAYDYIGTGGSLIDVGIFQDKFTVEKCPEDFVNIEDVWLSYCVGRYEGWKRKATRVKPTSFRKRKRREIRTKRALWSMTGMKQKKNRMVEYLEQRGYTCRRRN